MGFSLLILFYFVKDTKKMPMLLLVSDIRAEWLNCLHQNDIEKCWRNIDQILNR